MAFNNDEYSPIYVNYEVLVNAFNSNVIDFSQAEIYKVRAERMGKENFEKFLYECNEYAPYKF
jgi:hypothetical protein